MEIGGFFLLVVLLIVVAVLGGGVYAVAMWLRGKQLDPDGDRVEGEGSEAPRPEHLAVEGDQQSRAVGTP